MKWIPILLHFIKHPVWQPDSNKDWKYRITTVFNLIFVAYVLVFASMILVGIVQAISGAQVGAHIMDDVFKNNSLLKNILLICIMAPLIEEGIFRFPLKWFKNSPYFNLVFHLGTVVFALLHALNFDLSKTTIWIIPLLTLPQLIVGFIFSMIRIRFNFWWALLCHAIYNFLILALVQFSL
jgi:hypothetical protein